MAWNSVKAYFPFGDLKKKVGTVPTCSRRIFSLTNFNQSRCLILIFASHSANKVAKWKIGLTPIEISEAENGSLYSFSWRQCQFPRFCLDTKVDRAFEATKNDAQGSEQK